MDAAGKDGTIKHVMSGINPQGCQVYSFKQPSAEELDHDYLWRINRSLPERGRIGIFNRSQYEDVLIAKVHPEILLSNKLPGILKAKDIDNEFWKRRYRQINDFERYLTENGTVIIKFFLNVSKAEQKKRFMERLNDESTPPPSTPSMTLLPTSLNGARPRPRTSPFTLPTAASICQNYCRPSMGSCRPFCCGSSTAANWKKRAAAPRGNTPRCRTC